LAKIPYCTTVFGKNCEKICSGYPVKIINPNEESLEYAKQLVLLIKNTIVNG
jgi:hypothetical protein